MTTTKAISITSGGLTTAGLFQWETPYLILMAIGFVISIISLVYNEAHGVKSTTRTKLITKGLKHTLLGVFFFPTAYAYAGLNIWAFAPFQAFVAIALTFSLVSLYDAFIEGKIKKIKGE